MGEPMTDTAELVKELREKALRDTCGQRILAEQTAEWQAAAALSSTQARAEAAEASLSQANGALKAVNKLIEWERENGTHFVLIDREVDYVSGLWFDAKNSVIDYFKTAAEKE